MIFETDACALGFGYLADEDSRFTSISDISDPRNPYCVQINIDASASYRGPADKTSLTVKLPKAPHLKGPDRKITIPIWRVVETYPGGGKVLQMALDCERGTELESLAELSGRIHRKEAAPTEIVRRDVIFQQLLAAAEQLKGLKSTIGLLDPGNVLYYIVPDSTQGTSAETKEESIRLLLPDLFFVPTSGTPPWIESRQHYDFIWRPEYEKLLSSDDEDLNTTPDTTSLRRKYLDQQSNPRTFDPAKDSRALVRLLAWSLTGREIVEPIADIQFKDNVWVIIWDSLNSPQPLSPGQVAQRLQETGNRPREQNLPEAPAVRRPKPGGSSAMWVFLTVLILAGTAAAVYFFWPPPPPLPPVYALCRDCPESSPLHVLLTEKQLPLIREYHLQYPYLDNGDDLIFSFEVSQVQPVDDIKVETQNVFKAQMSNLEQQFANIKSALEMNSLTAAEKDCLTKELTRFQKALTQHFAIINPRLDSGLSDQAKHELASRFTESALDYVSTLKKSGLPGRLNPQMPRLLENKVPREYLETYGQHLELFDDPDQARDFVTMANLYASSAD